MNFREFKKERKRIFVYSMIIYLVLCFIYLSVAGFLHMHTNKIKRIEIVKNEERLVGVEKNILSNKVDSLTADLLFIADNFSSNKFGTVEEENIENKWKLFLDRKMIYDQIRYVDIYGNEKIRVNYLENGSVVASEGELQNKKDRYYFKETIGIRKEQVYISKMDLNMENGQVEQPIKPMIRLSTPVFDENSRLKGIVIINYYAQNLLQDFEKIAVTSLGNVFLLDSNGYYIYNNIDKNKEWAFMYEDKKDMSFKNEFPEEWAMIKHNEKDSIKTLNGYCSYENIIKHNDKSVDRMESVNDSIVLGEGNWIAVSFIFNDDKSDAIFFNSVYQNIVYMLKSNRLILLLLLIVSVSFAVLITLNKMSTDRTKYFSEYDTMTGVFNRRVGFEILNKTYRESMSNNKKVSVCFIDVNGLKEVNDNLGHEAGDELIISVVNGIKKCIRGSDFITRIGGDEFLIIFVNASEEYAESIWERINGEYKKINETENRKYIISASHGIEGFKFSDSEYIDTVINIADSKMYNEKRILKKDLAIIRK